MLGYSSRRKDDGPVSEHVKIKVMEHIVYKVKVEVVDTSGHVQFSVARREDTNTLVQCCSE